MQSSSPVRHLTDREASTIYTFSVAWFQRKRCYGGGPPFRKIGRGVRYPVDELQKWFEGHRLLNSTGEEPGG